MAKCTFMLGNFYSIFCNYHPVELTKQQWILGSSEKFADFDSFWPYDRTYKVAMDFGNSRNIADFD